MSRRFLAAVATAILVLVSAVPLASAGGPSGRFQRIDIANRIDAGLVPRLLDKTSRLTVMLQFGGDPVAVQQARVGRKLTTVERASIRGQLTAAQNGALAGIARAGARVVGQLQDAYNGVQVTVQASNVAALAALPGVIAVHGVQTFQRDNSVGVSA